MEGCRAKQGSEQRNSQNTKIATHISLWRPPAVRTSAATRHAYVRPKQKHSNLGIGAVKHRSDRAGATKGNDGQRRGARAYILVGGLLASKVRHNRSVAASCDESCGSFGGSCVFNGYQS